MSKRVLVVLSGGQDSTTCLGMACAHHPTKSVAAISFDYGQRHKIELEAAKKVASIFGVSHTLIKVPEGIFGGTSPLTNPNEELETYKSFSHMSAVIGDRVEKTFVPGRNLLFLAMAATFAAGNGFDEVWTGICESDNANYPDCRSKFVHRMNNVLSAAFEGQAQVSIVAPLLFFDKKRMVLLATELQEKGLPMMEALAHSHQDNFLLAAPAIPAFLERKASFVLV